LWEYLIHRFGIKSVLDVGAGQGIASLFFHRKNVLSFGIEGLKKNVNSAVYPLIQHDLTKAPFIMPVDLVLCVELVEHIDEEYIENLMDTLCNGNVVVMTHALPGQNGHHHVNCQPSEYWVKKFQERGYFLLIDNDYIKSIAYEEKNQSYFSKSGLTFIKNFQGS